MGGTDCNWNPARKLLTVRVRFSNNSTRYLNMHKEMMPVYKSTSEWESNWWNWDSKCSLSNSKTLTIITDPMKRRTQKVINDN